MPELRINDRLNLLAKIVAVFAFIFYCFWQWEFLSEGRIPPSILSALTGLPCPSTGCVRSLSAFAHGHWREGFLWNPATLPFLILLGWSLFSLIEGFFKHRKFRISPLLAKAWVCILGMAWVLKFALGRVWW